MHERLQIAVRPVDDKPTNGVLAVAAVLALEWAAPYADFTLGDDGLCVVDPDSDAVGGLLRLSSERAERLRLAGRAALQIDDSDIHLTENHEGDWDLAAELDSWSAAGIVLEASSFTASTPVGRALADILNISRIDDQRCVDVLDTAQSWAVKQLDQVVSQLAAQNPRRITDLLASLSGDLDTLSDTHSVLRARYQADIELMGRNR